MESNNRNNIKSVNKNIVNQLSKFFAGFGINFPTETFNLDAEYNLFRDNYAANFTSEVDINVMGIIKQLFEDNKSPSLNKKHLRKFLLTKEFCKVGINKLELPNCCICISEISLKQKTILIKCGHMYHDKCLIEWLRGNTKSCPMCRYDLKSYK
jgi:hypothetical protein